MDSLLSQATNLSLSSQDRVIQLSPVSLSSEDRSFSLVGKMLTTKVISMSTMKGASRRPWSNAGTIDYKFIGENTFALTFSLEANREVVWSKRPWIIADHLLAVKKCDDLTNPEDVSFDSMDIWVQLHNLPPRYKSIENVRVVANSYFRLLEIDRAGFQPGTWNRFVRIMVEIDLREPLPECFFIPTGQIRSKVDFVFEKVKEKCEACQKIGHSESSCQEDPGSPAEDIHGYLRSPGGTCHGSVRSPARIQQEQSDFGSSDGLTLSPSRRSRLSLQGERRTDGENPPTASSHTQKRHDEKSPPPQKSGNYFSPTTADLFPEEISAPYNSKGVKKAAKWISPRNIEKDLGGSDGLLGSSPFTPSSGLMFPPGFGPVPLVSVDLGEKVASGGETISAGLSGSKSKGKEDGWACKEVEKDGTSTGRVMEAVTKKRKMETTVPFNLEVGNDGQRKKDGGFCLGQGWSAAAGNQKKVGKGKAKNVEASRSRGVVTDEVPKAVGDPVSNAKNEVGVVVLQKPPNPS
ncbi:hypothetical protein LINPERHAP2_LOCUS18803 [Linum perenne]